VRHETTGKETTAPEYPKMQGWKLRETEAVAQCYRWWKMRHVNIRERQSIESRWLLNTGKRGQRLACLLMSDTLEYHFFPATICLPVNRRRN